MEEPDEAVGGKEGDIRSLYFWSRAAFVILVVAGALWVLLGAYRIYRGLTWHGRDWLEGSTQAVTDILVGAVFLVAAIVCFLLARWTQNDIVSVFSTRRFQVPREKLLVYSILAFPFGFVVPGVLLSLVNVKLSYPEFLPSHTEAYPEAMPGFVMVPKAALTQEVPVELPGEGVIPEEAPRELPPLGFERLPVTEEEARPAPEFFDAMPVGPAPPPIAAPVPEGPQPIPGGPQPSPMAAIVEEIEEEVPEVIAQVVEVVPSTVPEEAGPPIDQVPPVAEVEGLIEEVPPDEGFELLIPTEEEEEEAPKTIEEAHEELLGRLLRK